MFNKQRAIRVEVENFPVWERRREVRIVILGFETQSVDATHAGAPQLETRSYKRMSKEAMPDARSGTAGVEAAVGPA